MKTINEHAYQAYSERILQKEQNHIASEKNTKYTPMSYLLMFFGFAFLGWLWEVVLMLFTDGILVNRGVLQGPWLPIYGFGAVLSIMLLSRFKQNTKLVFVLAAIFCTVAEYISSWLLECFFNTLWWDYSAEFLNINGRVCLFASLFFALGACLAVFFAGPYLSKKIASIKPVTQRCIVFFLVMIFVFDVLFSFMHPNKGSGITYSIAATVSRIGRFY